VAFVLFWFFLFSKWCVEMSINLGTSDGILAGRALLQVVGKM